MPQVGSKTADNQESGTTKSWKAKVFQVPQKHVFFFLDVSKQVFVS